MSDLYISNVPALYREDFTSALRQAGFRICYTSCGDLDVGTLMGRTFLRHPVDLIRKERPSRVIAPEFSLITLQLAALRRKGGFHLVSLCDDSAEMIAGNDFSRAHRLARQWIPRLLDAIIVHSQDVGEWYRRHAGIRSSVMPIISDERRVRPDLERVLPLSEHLRPGGKPIVAFVGRLVKLKNIPTLLRAFEPFKDRAQLVIIGEGPERATLEAQSPDALFTGMLTGDELLAWYNLIDILVLPSTQEAYGTVTGEALMAGAKVIVSRKAGSSDLIQEGENGHVVEPTAVSELADRIGKLLDKVSSDRPLILRENLLPCRFEACIREVLKEINSL